MKKFVLLLASLSLAFTLTVSGAESSFPGLKAVLTPAEWQRAGLDRLTPDEIGVIDAALIRRAAATAAQQQAEIQKAHAAAASVALPPALEPAQKKRFLERFGLPFLDDQDWRNLPPLTGKVVAWESPNRFRLDNGQVWTGVEDIPYDLPGKAIEIHVRPNKQFVLFVDGKNTNVRVLRLR
jgi:hypothetical protein